MCTGPKVAVSSKKAKVEQVDWLAACFLPECIEDNEETGSGLSLDNE